MVYGNKIRVLSMADCIIDIMIELKETIKNGEYAVVTMAGGQRNETRA